MSSYVIVILWGTVPLPPPPVPTTICLLHKLVTVKSTQVKDIAGYTTVVLLVHIIVVGAYITYQSC